MWIFCVCVCVCGCGCLSALLSLPSKSSLWLQLWEGQLLCFGHHLCEKLQVVILNMFFSQSLYSLEMYFYLFPSFYHQTSGSIIHNCALTLAPAIQLVILSQVFEQPPHSLNLCLSLSWPFNVPDLFHLEILTPKPPCFHEPAHVRFSYYFSDSYLFASQGSIFHLAHSEQIFLMMFSPTLFSFHRLFLGYHISRASATF